MQTETDLFAKLGIPADYGRGLRRYADATQLVDAEHNIIGRMQQLAPATAKAWRELKQAALEEDIELLLVSGFRSIAYQVELFRNKLASGQSITEILRVNAAPGYSQHHTGRAIDLATPGARPLTEDFESTRAFAWMREHARRFGFNMPFKRDNPQGFIYKPWHWSQLDS